MRPHVLINRVLKGFCIVKVSSPLSCLRMMLCRVKRVKALEERSCLFLAMLIAIVMYILQIKSLILWCIIILYSGNKILFVMIWIGMEMWILLLIRFYYLSQVMSWPFRKWKGYFVNVSFMPQIKWTYPEKSFSLG